MSQIVPLQPVPNQTTQIVLNGQNCQIVLSQSPNALFMNLLVNDSPVRVGAICEDRNKIVRHAYLGFLGDLEFVDTQSDSDPNYTGLGSRYQLVYLTPAEANDQ
jgi:hypothetical protein